MGAGGSGHGACLTNWRGSSCDVCSSGEASATGGRTCGSLLTCYAERPGTEGTCDYEEATSDLQVDLARQVFACRCGGAS